MSEKRIAVNWYDRNPQPIANDYTVAHAPHSATERLSYQCPKDKMALIEVLNLKIARLTEAVDDGFVCDWWYYISPDAKLTHRVSQVNFVPKTLGQIDSQLASLMLLPNAILTSFSYDGSTGGTVEHDHMYKGYEFDPFPIEYELFPKELPRPDIQEPEKPWWWPF